MDDNELLALKDILSFCEERLKLITDKKVKTGYRDIKYLVKQHINIRKNKCKKY